MSDKLRKMFDSMPNSGSMEFFDNADFVGVCVSWSEKGRGFGEYTFSVYKKTGEFGLDNEADRPETVERVINRIIDENPSTVKKLFRDMLIGAHVDDPNWTMRREPAVEDE